MKDNNETKNQLVVFALEEQKFALKLPAVERVVNAVEVTPLPKAPDIVIGVINFQGLVIPVIDIRRRFGFPERAIDPSLQFIIAQTSMKTVALVVDKVNEVIESENSIVTDSKNITSGMEFVDGVIKLECGLILIFDLDRFLSSEEKKTLADAMKSKSKSQRLEK